MIVELPGTLNMNETKRWAVAILVSLVLSFGSNYWAGTISQVRVEGDLISLERRVSTAETINNTQERQIVANIIAISEVDQGWRTVAKAVDANTTQLTRFTEVLIRLEERSDIKNNSNSNR